MKPLTSEYNHENSSQISMVRALHETVSAQKVNNQHAMATKRDYSTKLCDIVFSYKPIYYCSRMFGLLPFSLEYDANGEIKAPKVSKFDAVWFVSSIAIYLMFANVIPMHIQKGPPAPILIMGYKLLLMFGLIYGAIIIVENMFSRFKFVKILKMFTGFDREASHRFLFSFSIFLANELTFFLCVF